MAQGVNDPPDILRYNATNGSRRSSTSDVFSDTNASDLFEVEALPSPTDDEDRQSLATPPTARLTHRPLSLQPPFRAHLETLHRSGSSQRYLRRNSFTSRRDVSTTAPTRSPSLMSDRGNILAESTPHRATSNASTITVPRTASPYRGTSGPSHPYAMYSQDTAVGRTLSNATSSTSRTITRSYVGPSRPTHPYGMYAQDTTSEEDLSVGAAATPLVALAAAGGHNRYQRRLGPEGEDADDFIGPDGHTEQLPPYTRYANDLPPKESPVEAEPPANAQRNPFGDSQVTLNAIPLQQTQIILPAAGASVQSSEASEAIRPADEGGHSKEPFAQKSKKRICGFIPMWILVLLIFIIVILVVGGAVGASLHHKHAHSAIPQASPLPNVTLPTSPVAATVTITSLIDAAPLTATPSNLPTLPTGSFSIPLKNSTGLSTSNDSCLTTSNQRNTWACIDGGNVGLELMPANGNPQVQLLSNTPSNAPILYGAQPPQLSKPANLVLMNDREDLDRGPTLFFQQLYDKVVVVREADFASDNVKRWIQGSLENPEAERLERRYGRDWNKNSPTIPTDRPWFCYWNNTAMEGFIYVTKDANSSTSILPSSALASSSNVADPSLGSSASDTGYGRHPAPAPTTAPSLQDPQAIRLPFPKVLKLEERRGPERSQPYCQQMQIMNDGTASPVTIAPQGDFNIVNLDEEEPMLHNRVARAPEQRRRSDVEKRNYKGDFLGSACRCQWLNE